MSTWTKADGAKIQLTFSQPLIGTITGNQAHFTVSVPEYDYVPGGTLGSVVKAVLSTERFASINEIVDLSGGTKTDVAYENYILRLAVM